MTFKSKDVTFENSKNIPFQRWYPYIEGYSPDFVKKIITDNVPNAKLIYEPFAGTGTTMFASDILNIPTIYSEVNPLMRFLIESKIDVLSMDAESRHNKAKILRNIASDIFEQLNEFSASDELKESYENVFKKAQSRLMIRLIAALALFLVPTLVQLLLGLINGISDPTCGLK